MYTDEGSYAVIEYLGENYTVPMSGSEWDAESKNYPKISFSKVYAKNMCDRITITVYDSSGTAISKPDSTTIGEELVGLYNQSSNKEDMKRLALVMLYYGAAAQKAFGYDIDNLATKYITD